MSDKKELAISIEYIKKPDDGFKGLPHFELTLDGPGVVIFT